MKTLVQIFFLNASFLGFGQNLITNPSFEEIDSCYGDPAALGFDVFEWSGCYGWTCPSNGSSDLWCENPVIGNITPPQIGGDFQVARTGNNFSSILVGDVINNNYREYVQNQLIVPLKPLYYYRFSCWVSAAGLPCTTSSFGVSTSNELIRENTFEVLNAKCIGKNNTTNFIVDTLNWQKIEIDFISLTFDNFIQFGSFTDSISLIESNCESNFTGHYEVNYFFLDDFELVEIGEFEIPNVISLNSNVGNEFLDFSQFIGDWKITITNRWGNSITSLNSNNSFWKPSENNISEGVYYIIFEIGDFRKIQILTIL